MEKNVQATIEASVLNDSIGKSLYAVGNDDLRPVFCGIYFTKKGDELQCAATNGSMLVRNTYKVEDEGHRCQRHIKICRYYHSRQMLR